MKYFDQNSLDIAKKIAAVIPPRETREQNAEVLTALSILGFAVAEKMDIDAETFAFGVAVLSYTANEALTELNEAGVVL